jgi:hypothetical protein
LAAANRRPPSSSVARFSLAKRDGTYDGEH